MRIMKTGQSYRMIYLIDLEYVETRYTSQWKTEFPQSIADKTGQDITVIEGPVIESDVSSGSFLDFATTNIYKSEQTKKISQFFAEGKIQDGDHFVFADAWHPGILNLKYMIDLLGYNVTTHGLWHAGSYDVNDFLGRKIGAVPWVRYAELAMFDAYSKNYFASQFHIGMFASVMAPDPTQQEYLQSKMVRTGWPMEYLGPTIDRDTIGVEKQDLILFPHRNAPEKQLEIFKDLEVELPEYDFVNCAEFKLKKEDYHRLLGQAKMVFSANLQETLGISCYEIMRTGGLPFVPNRLSYMEMYDDVFKYPSDWTENWEQYQNNRYGLKQRIKYLMENYNLPEIQGALNNNREKLEKHYFSAGNLYQELI